MATIDLTPGLATLRDAARGFFERHYGNPVMYEEKELHQDLEWTPSLRFVLYNHINVFVEPSETGPYPRILKLKHPEVLDFPQPIEIYAVCPEDAITSSFQQAERRHLQAHGHGLITVNHAGEASRVFSATPLVQVIRRSEFTELTKRLPLRIRRRVSEAFEDYESRPVNGVKCLSEIIEGLVQKAGSDAVKRGYIAKRELGNNIAKTLDALHGINQCNSIRPQIGGVRSYVSVYRNLSHHWPRNKAKSYEKFTDCRHAFLDGIKQVTRFRDGVKNVGFSGNLP